jgi:hypothetical protein
MYGIYIDPKFGGLGARKHVSLFVTVCLLSYRHLIFAVLTHVSSLITTQIYCTDIDQKFKRLGARKLVSLFVSVCLVSYRHLNFAVPTHSSSFITTQIKCTDIYLNLGD